MAGGLDSGPLRGPGRGAGAHAHPAAELPGKAGRSGQHLRHGLSKGPQRIKTNVKKIIEEGTASDEFNPVEINATANMLFAMLNGLMRQQIAGMDKLKGVEAAMVAFCRNALVLEP